MLVLKFTKTDTSSLVAHVDTLRAITYILRRAKVNAQYSQGFNPHMELAFSSPISLGVQSLCEYVSVKTDDVTNVLARLNAVCQRGISFTKAFVVDNVNLATAFNRATYKISAKGIGNVAEEILADGYVIRYEDRGKVVQKDVSARIFGAQRLDDDTALVTFATGNDNLRPDRVVLHLMTKHNLVGDYDVIKTQSLHDRVDSDDFLQSIATKTL